MMCFQKINNNNSYVLLCLGAIGTEPSDIELEGVGCSVDETGSKLGNTA